MTATSDRPTHVLVIYNTDYDAELIEAEGVDVSAVREAAQAIVDGVAACGFDAELVGVHGTDLDVLVARLIAKPPDLVFNACESMNGDVRNEALLPSLLDMLQVPYTGPDALAIGLCLHKDRAKDVLAGRDIPTPAYQVIASEADLAGALDFEYPYFLKLVHEDASIGIDASNVVTDVEALRSRARQLLSTYGQPVLAERYIAGREVNVTVLGGEDDLQCLPLQEIDFAAMPEGRPKIVSYAAKWDENHVDYEGTKPVPMNDVEPEVARAIRETSLAAFRALGLRDFGRVDLRVDADGQPWVIDINPNCDLSPDAGVARTAKSIGLDYSQLINRICEIAWSRRKGGAGS